MKLLFVNVPLLPTPARPFECLWVSGPSPQGNREGLLLRGWGSGGDGFLPRRTFSLPTQERRG